jgi:hypothetical protein
VGPISLSSFKAAITSCAEQDFSYLMSCKPSPFSSNSITAFIGKHVINQISQKNNSKSDTSATPNFPNNCARYNSSNNFSRFARSPKQKFFSSPEKEWFSSFRTKPQSSFSRDCTLGIYLVLHYLHRQNRNSCISI